MYIRSASVIASFVAVAALGTAAQAQSFSSGSYSVSSSAVEVEQSQNLNCNINGFAVSSSGGSTATVTVGSTLKAGDWLCPAVSLNGSNWTITATGGSGVTVSNISATPLLGGNCSGSVSGTYSGNTLTLPWQPIGSSTCYIGGTVTVNGLTLS